MAIAIEANQYFDAPEPEIDRRQIEVQGPNPNESGLDFYESIEPEFVKSLLETAQAMGLKIDLGVAEGYGICFEPDFDSEMRFYQLLEDYEDDNPANLKFTLHDLPEDCRVIMERPGPEDGPTQSSLELVGGRDIYVLRTEDLDRLLALGIEGAARTAAEQRDEVQKFHLAGHMRIIFDKYKKNKWYFEHSTFSVKK